MYPNFGKHIDFGADDGTNHDDHVHISFGWARAGHPDFLKPGSTSFYEKAGSKPLVER